MRIIKLLTITSLVFVLIGATYIIKDKEQPALKDAFKKHFLIGAALNDEVTSGLDPKAAAIVEKHFNTITSENEMKWSHIHPAPDNYNFEPADRFVKYGQKNNLTMIGHTLIWHSQIPGWAFLDADGKLLSRDAMLARMKDHIFTIMGRYKGKVFGWDVVNEALTDEGELNKTKWLETIGEDYISKAFEFANEADPNAELYYNDFSLDKPAKRNAVVHLVRQLKSKGIRLDGVGIQGHWGMDYPTKKDLDAFIDSIATCGVKVMVTEMDIDILPHSFDYMGADVNVRIELQKEANPYSSGLPDSMQQKLADRYSELFSQLLAHKDKVSRVTIWGIYDKTSWLNDWPIRGRTSYPLLFDRNYQPKPAFFAVLKTVDGKK
jgi:endo-1,4-beta-xylanase